MKKQKITSISQLINGIIFIVAGIMFLFKQNFVWNIIRFMAIGILVFRGFSGLLDLRHKSTVKKFTALLIFIINTGVSLFIYYQPEVFNNFVPYIVGWWALLNAIVQFIVYYAYRLDSLRHTGYVLLYAIITLIFSIILIINPISKLWMLSYISGAYIIFYGVCHFVEGATGLINEKYKNYIRKHIHVGVPIIVSSLIPHKMFMSLNKQVEKQNLKYYNHAISNDCDLEVFVYIKEKGPESLGHVDFSFNNKIYSYGCHDPNARRLNGTMGDGVLIVSNRDSFLNQAIQGDKKTIVSYGIILTEDEKELIQNRINEFLNRAVEWECNAVNDDSARDYASRVYKDTKCKMYKFIKGKFKTYFVFSTNCVLLVDELLRCNELNLINISGIVTPGSYIEFLNHQYLKPSSNVVSKTFYRD